MSVSGVATLVKQAVDIVDVVGQVVPLRRAGGHHVGLCPFHQEKTPSFHVDPNSQLFHCFGCGAGGDVLTFVMKYQNVPFSEALQYLAERYHIALPEREPTRMVSAEALEAVRREREQLYGVLRAAADYFYRQLHHSEAGRVARDYLQRRALPEGLIESERLGYAPARWDGLLDQLRTLGIDPEAGVRAGLLARSSKDSSRIYDRFRHRLIFPILDERGGRVIAFGGRKLEQAEGSPERGQSDYEEPKYLNSSESPVYHKGRTLYQLARAREACRQVRQVVVVEGYMDLLAFHAQGFYRVVATLGTALTPHQVRLLSRMADEAVLAYDADEAGEKAMLRALPLFLQEGLSVSCLRFPQGMDPDDFLRANGLAAFEALLQQRRELGLYAVRKALEAWDGSTGGKARVLQELQPVLDAVRQPVLKSEYLRLAADRLSLAESVILRQLHADRPRSGAHPAPAHPFPALSRQPTAPPPLEENIARAMLRYPDLIEELAAAEVIDCFEGTAVRALLEVMLRAPRPPHAAFDASSVYDLLPEPELRELFARLLLESGELSEPRVHVRDWLNALVERKAKRERQDLGEALRQAELAGDAARVRSILARIQDLGATRKKIRETPDNFRERGNR